MIICICHRITDRDIAREAAAGCGNFELLQEDLRVGTACGTCVDHARHVFQAHVCPGQSACRGHAGGDVHRVVATLAHAAESAHA